MKPSYKDQAKLLDGYIATLEQQKEQDLQSLKSQFHQTLNYYKPVNILNRTIVDIRQTPEVKTNLFESLISITGGYISKKIVVGKSNSLVKKILGYAFQYVITNFISKKVSTSKVEK